MTAEYDTVTPADVLGPLNEVETKYAPPKLFLAGDRELLRHGPRVSIVGSREASPLACRGRTRLPVLWPSMAL
jgi:predicted Rossmann fold nucleotide-binding protein DprA/Smf involved in DNA uptake